MTFSHKNGIIISRALSEYIEYCLYKRLRDIDKLNASEFVKLIKELEFKFKSEKDEDQISENFNDEQAKNFEGREGKENKEAKEEDEEIKTISDISIDNRKEDKHFAEKIEGLSEEELLEIGQKCFETIAQTFLDNKMTITRFFEPNKIQTKQINGIKYKVVKFKDFVNGLKKLKVKEFSELELECIMKIIGLNEDLNYLKLSDLAKILEDYNIQESKMGSIYELNFKELDEISLVILFALTELIKQEKIEFNKLVKDKIETIDDPQLGNILAISSKNFFTFLETIGIKLEEDTHENLVNFLSISPQNKEYLTLEKIKLSIDEFLINNELNQKALKYYSKLENEQAKISKDSFSKYILLEKK